MVEVLVGSAPIFGPKNAKVTIVEFSDFECPFCGRAAKTVSQLEKEYGKKIQIAFKHYPLPFHKQGKAGYEHQGEGRPSPLAALHFRLDRPSVWGGRLEHPSPSKTKRRSGSDHIDSH